MKWLWHSQGSDEKRHPLIEYEFTKRVTNKRISIKCVPHFDISIESRPRPLKASHVSYLNLQAIYLVCSKIFHMQLIKHLASEDLYLQMKNMLLNHIWKIGFAKKNMKKFLSFILTTWRMSTRKHALTQGIITCREKWYLW